LRDAAIALPFIGLFLLMPPVVTLFVGTHVAGVPLVVAYIFAVWLGLVLAAALLARRLDDAATPADDETSD
jgi:hypothetical protein